MKALDTARSIMTDTVISVSPEASLLDVLRLFVEEDIHGAPVADSNGEYLGVISTSDLMRAQEEEHNTVMTESDYLRGFLDFTIPVGSGTGVVAATSVRCSLSPSSESLDRRTKPYRAQRQSSTRFPHRLHFHR